MFGDMNAQPALSAAAIAEATSASANNDDEEAEAVPAKAPAGSDAVGSESESDKDGYFYVVSASRSVYHCPPPLRKKKTPRAALGARDFKKDPCFLGRRSCT